MDFLHLFKKEDVQVQIGGADQWGTSLQGLKLIRKSRRRRVSCVRFNNSIDVKIRRYKIRKIQLVVLWLDPEKTTPYEFYQFWLNQDDPRRD